MSNGDLMGDILRDGAWGLDSSSLIASGKLTGRATLAGLAMLVWSGHGDTLSAADAAPPSGIAPAGQVTLGTASEALDIRCERCHHFTTGLTHPVDIPSAAPGNGLPLVAGRIVCTTCHDDRASRPHGGSQRGLSGNDPMLRMDSVEGLCSSCHRPTSRDRASVHALGILQAHLDTQGSSWAGGSSNRHRGGIPSAVRGSQGVDAESSVCMTCHDGTVAADVAVHIGSAKGMRGGDMEGASSHPIGVVYNASVARDAVQLRSLGSLDRRIRLFNQRVGCGSCHSVFSRQQDFLVFPNDRSVLCLSCHRM